MREARDTAGATNIVDRMLAQHGTYDNAIRVLAGEAYVLREEAREHEEEIEGLRARQIPDGAVVLTGDEAKALTTIKATGVALDKVAERVKLAGDLEGQQAANTRRTSQDAAAKALNWNPAVLAPLLDSNKYVIELRDVVLKEAGKQDRTVKVPYVREDKPNAAWEKLDELVARADNLKPFLPALKTVTTNANGADGSSSSGSAASTTGGNETIFAFTQTPSQGDGSSADPVDRFIASRNKRADARSNPLVRSTAGPDQQNGKK